MGQPGIEWENRYGGRLKRDIREEPKLNSSCGDMEAPSGDKMEDDKLYIGFDLATNTCNICNVTLSSKKPSHVRRHLRAEKHTQNRDLEIQGVPGGPEFDLETNRCNICQATYSSRRHLKKHLMTPKHFERMTRVCSADGGGEMSPEPEEQEVELKFIPDVKIEVKEEEEEELECSKEEDAFFRSWKFETGDNVSSCGTPILLKEEIVKREGDEEGFLESEDWVADIKARRTEEAKERKRKANRERIRRIRANMSEEERKEYRRKKAEWLRQKRARMTKEEREEYNRKRREREGEIREKEKIRERGLMEKERIERQSEMRRKRRERRKAIERVRENDIAKEQLEARRKRHAEYMKRTRAKMTEEELLDKRRKDRELWRKKADVRNALRREERRKARERRECGIKEEHDAT